MSKSVKVNLISNITVLVKASSVLPDYLQRHGFQAWKVLEETKFVEKEGIGKQGYIIPVTIISGHPASLELMLDWDENYRCGRSMED